MTATWIRCILQLLQHNIDYTAAVSLGTSGARCRSAAAHQISVYGMLMVRLPGGAAAAARDWTISRL
jgi:hypothetical protein